MRLLGIDYGRKKIGLALGDSETKLAEPLKVIVFEDEGEAVREIEQVLKGEQVGRVVVGVSEGKMGQEARGFGEKLKKKLDISVVFQDETLTTQEAQELAIKAGIRRKKRKSLEDAYSAALILQSYFEGLS